MKKNKFLSKLFFLVFLSILTYNLIQGGIGFQYHVHKELKVNGFQKGTLMEGNSQYYNLTLPDKIEPGYQFIVQLMADNQLDAVDNIYSDPNLYISMLEAFPNEKFNTWSSQRYGSEIVSIGENFLKPNQIIYFGVYCEFKCNYILMNSLVKGIQLLNEQINVINVIKGDVKKFYFHTLQSFNKITISCQGTKATKYKVYVAKENPSSSNTFPNEPILTNGYRFTLNPTTTQGSILNSLLYVLVHNEGEAQDIKIWITYDNKEMLIKEADPTYEAIQEAESSCFYYEIQSRDKNKDIILSTTLFNGEGYIQFGGWVPLTQEKIKKNENNQDRYNILRNKAIRLTSSNSFNRYGHYNENKPTNLYFCFYAKKPSSILLKMYYLENTKLVQSMNVIYPGIANEDYLLKDDITRYKLEMFDVNKDIYIKLNAKQGDPKLYLIFSEKGGVNIDHFKLDNILYAKEALIGAKVYSGYSLEIKKEVNKCIFNKYSKINECQLVAIVHCKSEIDCIYEIDFDHTSEEVSMKPRVVYSNVITQGEIDHYNIKINDPSIKNIGIVLSQNTGKTILRFNKYQREDFAYEVAHTEEYKESEDHVLHLRAKNGTSIQGTIYLEVKGESFASYSIYYYPMEDYQTAIADHSKIAMTLDTGRIIEDAFFDSQLFKIYLYDNSRNPEKTDLYITLVETSDINCELYIFTDLDDFSINERNKIEGYVWKGKTSDYVYIDKTDKHYIENDYLYIMVYKHDYSSKYQKKNNYATFFLGVTDEKKPFLLSEGKEFKHALNKKHPSQKFYYTFIDNGADLKVSISLYYGRVLVSIGSQGLHLKTRKIQSDSEVIKIDKETIGKICNRTNEECGIDIKVTYDSDYRTSSTFLITCISSNDVPTLLKQGVINKRTILGGDTQYYIIDVKANFNDPGYELRINALFSNGQGELYARKLMKTELVNIVSFPDENNYEYSCKFTDSYKNLYTIHIPYNDIKDIESPKILLSIKGTYLASQTKIEYTIQLSNSMSQILTDKPYQLFISKGELTTFRFNVGPNKKRLYIAMTNKDQDANMFLNYESKVPTPMEYTWKNTGAYNEYLDVFVDDPFFVQRGMSSIDGEYYLLIQGLGDCFYNLYISTQDVKLINVAELNPAGCSCQNARDYCYFRFENINDPEQVLPEEKEIIFYTEFTYGSGDIYAKLYPKGNLEEIMNNLPNKNNNDYQGGASNEFLDIRLKENNQKYTTQSVMVIGVECKEKALFDFNVFPLTASTELSRNKEEVISLQVNRDNMYYLSPSSGKPSKLSYYINKEEILNFQVKAYQGSAKIHTYTNSSSPYYTYFYEDNEEKNVYHHIADYEVSKEKKKTYSNQVSRDYGYGNYLYFEVTPTEKCLLYIGLSYENEMTQLRLNQEKDGHIGYKEYLAYFDFPDDTREVILTVTSLSQNANFDVFIKANIMGKSRAYNPNFSKASETNYDQKATSNPLTNVLTMRIKNPLDKEAMKSSVVKILINIQSSWYYYSHDIRVVITPVLNDIIRIKPEQKKYYFNSVGSGENREQNVVYFLKKQNIEDDLMVIEISSCKGFFGYKFTDTPITDSLFSFNNVKKIETKMTSSNGKKIITIPDIQDKDYYLILFSSYNLKQSKAAFEVEKTNTTEVLFFYYTTTKKLYSHTVTHDMFFFTYNKNEVELHLPELKVRNTLGKENKLDQMSYLVVVSDKEKDFSFMDSTCYLSKMFTKYNGTDFYKKLDIKTNKTSGIVKVGGLADNKVYYINVLIVNDLNGEVLTYHPVVITQTKKFSTFRNVLVVFLSVVVVVLLYIAFVLYRKYKIGRMQLNINYGGNGSADGSNKNIGGQLAGINLNAVKKKYSSLNEDEKSSE